MTIDTRNSDDIWYAIQAISIEGKTDEELSYSDFMNAFDNGNVTVHSPNPIHISLTYTNYPKSNGYFPVTTTKHFYGG